MTISVIQSSSTQSSATGTAITQTFSSSLTAGNAIHAIGTCDAVNNTTISSFTDGTNTYSSVLDQTNDSTNAQTIGQAVASNVASGTPTVSCNFASSRTFRGIWIKEIGGCTTSPLDGHNAQLQSAAPTTTDGVSSNTATNTNQPALISGVSLETKNNGEALSAGTGFVTTPTGEGAGWNNIYGTAHNEGFSENKRITTTTAVAATFTASVSSAYLTIMAIFDESTADVPTAQIVC